MEVFNNIATQQNTQIQSEAKTVDIKSAPKVDLKVDIKTAIESANIQPVKTEIDLRDLIDNLNKALDPFNTSIRFGFDNSSDVFYVSVIDSQTNDTIRRFPVEQAQTLAAKINEVVGLIFDEKG